MGSLMHLIAVVLLRMVTSLPLFTLGFSASVMQACPWTRERYPHEEPPAFPPGRGHDRPATLTLAASSR